jgi:Tfp pilus assembly protein PilF
LTVLKPEYAGGFYLLGVCQSKRHRDMQAAESLKRSISLEPQFLHAYCELGRVQRRLGQQLEARENLLRVLGHSRTSPSVLRKAGVYLLEAGWLDQAIEAYSHTVLSKDARYEDWNNRGVAYLRKQAWGRAEKDFLRALQEDPRRPEACSNLGIVYVQQRAYQKARDSFLQALGSETSSLTLVLNAAVVYGQYLEDAEMATKHLRDYMDRGGTFQRSVLQGWLDETTQTLAASLSQG